MGNKPTYVDFAVFQALDNDEVIGAAPVSFPLIAHCRSITLSCPTLLALHTHRALMLTTLLEDGVRAADEAEGGHFGSPEC